MSNEEDRKAPSDLASLMGGLLAAAKRADYFQTGEALLLLKAFDTLKQMQTDLDTRFEHSDHTAAKYYQRMRAAEKEAAMRRSESADFARERDEAVARLEATEEGFSEAQAVMTAYHLAQSTGMSVEQVVTTLREIGSPAAVSTPQDITDAKERGYTAVRAGGWITDSAYDNARTWSAVEAALTAALGVTK